MTNFKKIIKYSLIIGILILMVALFLKKCTSDTKTQQEESLLFNQHNIETSDSGIDGYRFLTLRRLDKPNKKWIARPLKIAEVVKYLFKEGELIEETDDRYHLVLALSKKSFSLINNENYTLLHEQKDQETLLILRKAEQKKETDTLATVAGIASTLGGLIYHGADLVSAATNVAVSTLSRELERLLSGIATANIQFDVDKDLSFKNSKLELLFPVCDRDDYLFFVQTNFHTTDNRSQGNLGLGYRWLSKEWMLGANVFFDYDFSRGHSRAGFGGEYSRDFVRVSVNKYMPLSGWKTSPDVIDYEEMPASGWDVRIKFWMPSYPQLGGKFIYEEYYGDEVALFRSSWRSKNPITVTAGLNYSPFPLLTFSLEHKHGLSEEGDDTSFKVEVNYELGVPWATQIDPITLSTARSLIHSRYELVDRNNNIVLVYRKQVLIVFKMARIVSGYGGQQKSLSVVKSAKYGPLNIDWDKKNLVAAGGALQEDTFMVTFPNWQADAENSYTISAIAEDQKGNKSERQYSTILVKERTTSSGNSAFTFENNDSSPIFANGKDTKKLILEVKNAQSELVDVAISDIEIRKGYSYQSSVSSPVKTGTGTYEITVTAGTAAENVELTAYVQGEAVSPSLTVVVTSIIPVEKTTSGAIASTLEAKPQSILANNSDVSTLTLTAVNEAGIRIKGIKNALSFTVSEWTKAAESTTKVSEIREDPTQTGVYTADLTIATAGNYKIIAKYLGEPIGELAVNIIGKEPAPEGSSSTFSTSSSEIIANGSDSAILTLELKDSSSIAITGMAASLSFTTATGAVISKVIESEVKGTYTATITASSAANYTITANYNNSPIDNLGTLLITAKKPTASGAKSNFKISSSQVVANDYDEVTLTLILRDTTGVLLSDADVAFTSDPSAGITIETPVESTSKGTYTAQVKVSVIGKYDITANYDGSAISGLAALSLTGTAQSVDGNKSMFTAEKESLIANSTDSILFTLALKDASGIEITGAASSLAFKTATGATMSSVIETSTPGTYTASMTASTAALYTVVPYYSNNPITPKSLSIQATTPLPNGKKSSFTLEPNEIQANNKDKATLTFTLRDEMGVVISGKTSSIAFSDAAGITISDISEETNSGIYTATVTGSSVNSYTISATYEGAKITDLDDVILSVIAQKMSGKNSKLSIAGDEIQANGKDTVTLSLVLNDTSGVAITGLESYLTFTAEPDGSLISQVIESTTKGTYTATFAATKVTKYTITAKYNANEIESLNTVEITPKAQIPSDTLSKFSLEPSKIQANDFDSSTITLQLKDTSGELIADVASLLTFTTAAGVDITEVTQTATQGTYTATLTASKSGSYQIMANYYNEPIGDGKLVANITVINQVASADNTDFSVDPSTILANDSDDAVLTLVLKDTSGQAIKNVADILSMTTSDGAVISKVEETSVLGTYTARLTASKANSYQILPMYNNEQIGAKSVTVIANVPLPNTDNSSFTAEPTEIQANNKQTATLTLQLKDDSDVIMTGKAALLKFTTDDGATISSVSETATKGTYTATLISATIGAYTITASYNNSVIAFSTEKSPTVNVIAQIPSGGDSSLTNNPDTILANQVDIMTLTLALNDKFGVPITGIESELTLKTDPENGVTVSNLTETSTKGTYQATLTASVAATYKITVYYKSSKIDDLELSVVIAKQTPSSQSKISIAPDSILANSHDIVEVTTTLIDSSGEPITGAVLSYNKSSAVILDSYGETGSGVYYAKFTATAAEEYTIEPTFDGETFNKSVTFIAQQPTPDGSNSSLAISQGDLLANSTDTKTLTLVINDKSDVVLSGIEALLSFTSSAGLNFSDTTETSTKGTYTATVTSSKAGNYSIVATYGGEIIVALNNVSLTTITPTPQQNSTFTAPISTVIANNNSTVTLKLEMKDQSSVPMTGNKDLLQFIATKDDAETTDATIGSITESETGVYTATFKASVSGSYTIKPYYNDSQIGSLFVTVTATKQTPGNTSSITILPDKIKSNGDEQAALTLILKDDDKQTITGATSDEVTFSVEPSSGVVIGDISETETKGTYQANITASTAGNYTVSLIYKDVAYSGISATVQAISPVNATIEFDESSYIVDDQVSVEVTLIDENDNLMTGLINFVRNNISLPGIDNNEDGTHYWTEKSAGLYVATFVAQRAGSDLYGTLSLADFGGSSVTSNDAYTIIMPEISSLTANSMEFTANVGFPTIGFMGAQFSFGLSAGNIDEYEWTSSNTSFASVNNDAVVTFGADSLIKTATITATPTSNYPNRTALTYEINLFTWLTTTNDHLSWAGAESKCNDLSGGLPPQTKLTSSSTIGTSGNRGIIGNLYGEWGSPSDYEGASLGEKTWTSTSNRFVSLIDGKPYTSQNSLNFICIQ